MDEFCEKTEQKTLETLINSHICDSEDGLQEDSPETSMESMSNSEDTTSSDQMSISFTGCGLLGLYYIGVIACLRKYLSMNKDIKICGASSGALAALTLCLNLPIESSTSKLVEVAIKARNKSLGMMHPGINLDQLLYEFLQKILPEDCHKRASGRLFLSVTRVSDGKNYFLSQFDSKENLIRAMQCSCYIPFVSGIVPHKFHGISYIDGAFSNNFPKISENTITVSAYGGESDICPRDDPYIPYNFNFFDNSIQFSTSNMYRLKNIILPDHPNSFLKLCDQGFNDAIGFLLRKNKIRCTSCLSTQLSNDLNDNKEIESYTGCEKTDTYFDNSGDSAEAEPQLSSIKSTDCEDCQIKQEVAEKDSLPDPIIKTIEEMCSQFDKRVKNWILLNLLMKLVSILSTPFLMSIDFTYVMSCKVWQQMPVLMTEHRSSFYSLVIFVRSVTSLGRLKYV